MNSWSPLDIMWLLFFLSVLLPGLRQRMLESARVRLLRAFERKRGSRVIAMIHRQESMALFGFPLFRFINIQDSEEVLRAIRLTEPQCPIDFIIHTPGGLVLAAEQIARALRQHQGKVTVFVPHYAMSGGTLLALAADEIVMDPFAVLGPVDPQLGARPAASIVRVAESKPIEHVDDQTLVEADISRKALAQMKRSVTELLSGRFPPEQAETIAERLTQGYYTHDYPITVEEARELGLSVSTDFPPEIHEIMALYPQPAAYRPSVQYFPEPYGPKHGPSSAPRTGGRPAPRS